MRQFTGLVAGCLAVLVCCHAFGGDAAEQAKLQGTWELTELVVGGVKVPEKDVQGTKFVIKGDELNIVPSSADSGIFEKRAFKIKIDSKKNPTEVDLTALDGELKGVTSAGIYELKGDSLRWCQNDDEKAKDRPKDFTSPEKSRIYVITFKRAK